MSNSPKELEWKDPEPKPPDEEPTIEDLLARLQALINELQNSLFGLRRQIAKL